MIPPFLQRKHVEFDLLKLTELISRTISSIKQSSDPGLSLDALFSRPFS